MPSSIRPGDVLADRYRLVDLLTESGGGRFWRAHDRVLERHVALHVIAADDERAPALLEAARRSALVHDPRLLRVLDADQVDGLCFVVNEWGTGDSLDIMLANDGPLGPRRAAWLVSEVAASIAACHDAGVAHGRLIPENVLVDHTGAVRLIGFSVDAAMHGLPPGRVSADVADLGALLYSALTGKWPGVSTSTVPPAPLEQGRVLRPRQVRAGIPRPLDALCDEVVNPYTGGFAERMRDVHDVATAHGIADYLCAFVGDPTGLAEAEALAGHRDTETASLPAIADPPARSVDPTPAPAPEPVPEPEPEAEPEPVVDELATEAGLPIFDDETDDVSWFTARSEPAPPPPPFEEPPERPLFAPSPAGGAPARTPRSPRPAGAASAAYWPWDTGTGSVSATPDDPEPEEVPGRNWLRLAALIAACLLLLVACVVAYNLGRGRTPLGAIPDDEPSRPPSSQTSPSASVAAPIAGITASDFDPQGDPPEEYPELAALAVDGDPDTAWHTQTYDQDFGPGGLKTGVGLVLDLGESHDVAEVDLTLIGSPTDVSVYVTDTRPTGVRDLTPAASATGVGTRDKLTLDPAVPGRYVTVWLTSLPQVQGGFRGEVAEVTVRG
ncbi:protein kinase family protein [Nocardioides sp. CN2-186]|uniref:protein kinase family protein n=1 Tax=Nocardioides tweenelious TaxID=3156607 RepID=UPI0032B5B3BF